MKLVSIVIDVTASIAVSLIDLIRKDGVNEFLNPSERIHWHAHVTIPVNRSKSVLGSPFRKS